MGAALPDTQAGQAVYTPLTLALYDAAVLGFNNHLIWRCPTRRLLAHYNTHVRARHLDVGVGSGYYLDRCVFPAVAPEITLFDLNANALAAAARRIRRYCPRLHQGDVLDSSRQPSGTYDSIAVNYLLHCLPGNLDYKARALTYLAKLLPQGGVIFGSTILNGGVSHTALSARMMRSFNAKGIFGNLDDDLPGLHRVLADISEQYEISVVGAVALFAVRP